MEARVKKLLEQLSKSIDAVNSETCPVKGFNKKTELAEGAIRELKSLVNQKGFENKAMETAYFKFWAPSFFKLQLLYTLHYNLERARITASDKEEFIRYQEKQLRGVKKWLKKHEALRVYHVLGQSDRDHELFVHSAPSKEETFLYSEGVYCKNSIALAKIMAYEEFLPCLSNELDRSRTVAAEKPTLPRKYTWKSNNRDAGEVIYGLEKMKCIGVDGQDADIKDITEMFAFIFSRDFGNIYDIHLQNKRRKKDKAPFLSAMLNGYLGGETAKK